MLGGMSRMTISLCIILVETTNNMLYLLPIMLVLMIAKWVGDPFNISLYDLHLQLKGIPFVEAEPSKEQEFLAACHIMHSPVLCLKETETVRSLLRVLRSCTHNGFPVITSEHENYVGLVTRNQLAVILRKIARGAHHTQWKQTPRAQKKFAHRRNVIARAHQPSNTNFTDDYLNLLSDLGAPEPELDRVSRDDIESCNLTESVVEVDDVLAHLHPLDFTTSLSSTVDKLEDVEITPEQGAVEVDLRSFMNPVPLAVQEVCPVTRVFRVFRGLGLRHLVVVDVQNHVMGMITRAELAHDPEAHAKPAEAGDEPLPTRERADSGPKFNEELKTRLMTD
eukprot:TRINITY_DN17024_c0_g1_i8.p1 TRINITY_DN17024_c0_g1~~TRINITY_DN17024_c0_g1_i8.p1  ORF type:complete len:337 (-),score=80.40 TRINITY_DN17024_c0_g1_i8:121-1131(-)